MTTLSVDILAYINDCHDSIPETERKWIAEKIASKYDYTQIYDDLDDWISTYTEANNINCKD